MNARDFMRAMNALINSPSQRLIRDANGGYVYADEKKPELMYAAAKINEANRRAEEARVKFDAAKQTMNSAFGAATMFEIKKSHFQCPCDDRHVGRRDQNSCKS